VIVESINANAEEESMVRDSKILDAKSISFMRFWYLDMNFLIDEPPHII